MSNISINIYSKWGNMKYKYRNREFWCRGYYVDTVGKNTKKIKEYIANQLKDDQKEQLKNEKDRLDAIDRAVAEAERRDREAAQRVADMIDALPDPYNAGGLRQMYWY